LKPNLGYPDARRHEGRLIARTEPCVAGAVLRMIREVNKNEVIVTDGPYPHGISRVVKDAGYERIIKKCEAKLVDANEGPYVDACSGRWNNFPRYCLNREIAGADAVVSIAKLKVHLLTGVSLCVKNLFEFPPVPIYGYWNARWYLHYPIRLPRCLVDLTSIFKPCLNLIDGMVGENVQEWQGPRRK